MRDVYDHVGRRKLQFPKPRLKPLVRQDFDKLNQCTRTAAQLNLTFFRQAQQPPWRSAPQQTRHPDVRVNDNPHRSSRPSLTSNFMHQVADFVQGHGLTLRCIGYNAPNLARRNTFQVQGVALNQDYKAVRSAESGCYCLRKP
jgi:hypothetical protein